MLHGRSTLLVYNTVERLLRGDFFHSIQIAELRADLRVYPGRWPVVGLGTSNWYRRNGETIVEGDADAPRFLWADPAGEKPGAIIDLSRSRPTDSHKLQTPMGKDDDLTPSFPFITFAVCDPAVRQCWEAPPQVLLHEWIEEKMRAENVGLAAVRSVTDLASAEYTAICHIPLEGLDLSDGYSGGEAFRFGTLVNRRWNLCGIYAANPTVQNMVSIQGHPLHLHGFTPDDPVGGHVNTALAGTGKTQIDVWPLKDLVMQIRDLDAAWLPVRLLDQKEHTS